MPPDPACLQGRVAPDSSFSRPGASRAQLVQGRVSPDPICCQSSASASYLLQGQVLVFVRSLVPPEPTFCKVGCLQALALVRPGASDAAVITNGADYTLFVFINQDNDFENGKPKWSIDRLDPRCPSCDLPNHSVKDYQNNLINVGSIGF